MKPTNKYSANLKNNTKDLILLFAVPTSIVALASLFIYMPRILANPKYDFIYSVCDSYNCKDTYYIDDNSNINLKYNNISYNYSDKLSYLRYYKSSNNSTRPITLQEANGFKLDTSSKSPDGYALNQSKSGSNFLFWDNYDDKWYLKNGMLQKSVDLSTSDVYYRDNIKFLGWVVDEK